MKIRSMTREEFMKMHPEAFTRPEPPTPDELAAIRRVLDVAKGDTGQSKRCADFLLAWWNADKCGGFDLTDTWGVDAAIARDMVAVFGLVSRFNSYPDGSDTTLAEFEADFRALVCEWRPNLK